MSVSNKLVLFSARGSLSFSPEQRTRLESAFEVKYVEAPEALNEREFARLLEGCKAAAITPRALPRDLSPEFWANLSSLEVIFLPTTGTEWFPMATVQERGVVVENLAGYSGQSTAEFAWGLLLALQRHIVTANRRVLTGAPASLLGRDLCGRSLGVVGCGDVGQRVAKFGEAFGMAVSVFDAKPVSGFRQTSLENIFSESDVISIHLPLTSVTRAFFCEALFSRTRPGLLIVNTARPALIPFELIARLLDSGRLSGYAIDQGYFSREEILPLARHPRVLAVPHISWYTCDSIEREMESWVETMTRHQSAPSLSSIRERVAELV